MASPQPPSPRFEDWVVEVRVRPGLPDRRGEAAAELLREEGLPVRRASSVRGYVVRIEGGREAAERAAEEVFLDPITDRAEVRRASEPPPDWRPWRRVDVVKRPGVMDPASHGILRALATAGIRAEGARTYDVHLFETDAPDDDLLAAARRALGNEAIEEIHLDAPPSLHVGFPDRTPETVRLEVELHDDDEALLRVSRDGGLSLTLTEMRAIRAHYRALGRRPTEIELETIAQTWSEHCKHKTLTGPIRREGRPYRNLLRETIFRATEALDRPFCVSVFVDNAGVVAFDEQWLLTFKVETHNHPSAIEPYGGAGTGLGGVLRDTMGTGRGARPIVSTDVFCVGPLDLEDPPPGTLKPRRILRGVTEGVRDYGNRMGIPTANGAVLADPGYTRNPLVFCGSVGLLPSDRLTKHVRDGDLVVLAGGRTGRDGIHGATFSSRALHDESERVDSGAVQIGDPITEKKLLDALMEARDADLYGSITDCGAGGLSSAVGEMADRLGAVVDLEKVPLKYAGLTPTEIWISEAQERMVLAVPPERAEKLLALFARHDVEATVIGRFEETGRLVLRYAGQVVGELDLDFLHRGLPRVEHRAEIAPPPRCAPFTPDGVIEEWLERVLAHPDVASKEWVVRQYDHEVRAATVVKPLMGPSGAAPADGAVIRPFFESFEGFALGCGICPRVGRIDPYAMGLFAVDEAVRNVIAAGARADRVSLLDNFCAGNTDDPRILGEVVLVAEALRDAALALGCPFISGKDSLHNEYRTADGVQSIPTTILVSALGLVDDVRRSLQSGFTRAGRLVGLVGETGGELGGSVIHDLSGRPAAPLPSIDLPRARRIFEALSHLAREGFLTSCHDLSDGGLAVAAAESTFGTGLGVEIDLRRVPRSCERIPDLALLFSESPTRFLVEFDERDSDRIARALDGLPFAVVGRVTDDGLVRFLGQGGEPLACRPSAELERIHRTALAVERCREVM